VKGGVWARELLERSNFVESLAPSVVVFDGAIGEQRFRTIAIVADPESPFPRARNGECGLREGLAIAQAVRDAPSDAAIISIVDAPGQAFGRREERAGISLSLAAAVDAYVTARRNGRPLFTLIVGKAISGAFLAHGMQGGWIGSIDSNDVEVHVMSAASVARVTRMSDAEVARVARTVRATARDIATFADFGAIDQLFGVADPKNPTTAEIAAIREAIVAARVAGLGTRHPVDRLQTERAVTSRALARDVRARIDAAW
jgi:malonate decarboxylase gamma subunit